jgi:uncharacterized repeat protein (TIGR01451 family)
VRTRLAVLACLALPGSAWSQTYDLSWRTVDGGGVTFAQGAALSLGATIGQPDAGILAGGQFRIAGGFWAATLTPPVTQTDLGITKTDGQADAVPGQGVAYTILVTNAGPDDAVGAIVTDVPPAALGSVAWTCTASPGSTCAASGSGTINDTVTLLNGGALTYTLTAGIDPAATGSLANTAAVLAPGGDPVPSNNAATDTDALTPQADLAVDLADSPDPVGQGHPLTYVAAVSNLGPSASTGSTLSLDLPPEVAFVSSIPGPPDCVPAAGGLTCGLAALAPGGGATVTVTATVGAGVLGSIGSSAIVTGNESDPAPSDDTDAETTAVVLAPEGELGHGTLRRSDLRALPGPTADEHRYRNSQKRYSSYEVVLDEASGDIGAGSGPALERVGSDGTSVVQSSLPVGTGKSRSLRWENPGPAGVDDETVRVRSQGCAADCGPEDVYRIRAYDTTCASPRFNDSATQVTVLLLQSTGDAPITGHALFWDAAGSLLETAAFSLAPHGLLSLNTATLPALLGHSGSITVTHDGRYGELSGKAVAVEPATGFTFDSELLPRPR